MRNVRSGQVVGRKMWLVAVAGALGAMGLGDRMPGASAASYSWNYNGTTNNKWNVAGNWTPNTAFPNAIGDSAILGGNIITADRAITLGQNVTVGSLAMASSHVYTVTGNTLIFSVNTGNASLTVTNDGGDNGAHVIASAVQLTNNLDVSVTDTGNLTISGNISGAGQTLTKSGPDDLILSGSSNTFGQLVVLGGGLQAKTSGAFGTSAITLGDATGGDVSLLLATASLAVNNPITVAAGTGNVMIGGTHTTGTSTYQGTLNLGRDVTLTATTGTDAFAGLITANGHTIIKDGSGTVQLNNANNQLSGVTILNGTLSMTANQTFGSLAMKGGTLATGTAAVILGGNVSYNGTSAAATISGNLNLGGTARDFNVGTSSASTELTVSAVIANDGGLGITKSGTGVMALTGTANTFTGATNILAGTLAVNSSGNFGSGNAAIALGAATLETKANLLLSRDLTLNDVTSTVLVDASTTATLAGMIAGTGRLTKDGTGTMFLTNSASSYLGGTTIKTGTLKISSAGSVGSGLVLISTGSTLALATDLDANALIDPTSTGLVTLAPTAASALTGVNGSTVFVGTATTTTYSGTTFAPGSGNTYRLGGGGGTLTIASTALKDQAGVSSNLLIDSTVILAAAQTYTGTTTVATGDTLTINAALASTAGAFTGGTTTLGANNVLPSTMTVTLTSGTLAMGTFSDTVGAVSLQSGSVTGTGTLTSLTDFDVRGGTMSAILAGSVGLTKTTTGTVTLNGSNSTYTGPTTINAGTLKLGVNAALPSAGTALVNSGGTLDLNGKNQTLAGLTLTGGTVQSGAGVLTLTGNVAYTGTSAAATISGNLNLGGAARVFNVADGTAATDLTVSAVVSNDGGLGLTKSGAGLMALTGNNTFTGPVTITAGTLAVDGSSSFGSGTTAIALGAATLEFTADKIILSRGLTLGDATSTVAVDTNTTTFSGVVAGAGRLNKSGTGILVLTNSGNSYLGGTTINAGTLSISNPGNVNNGPVLITAAGTLVLTANLNASALIDPASTGLVALSASNNAMTGVNGSAVFFGALTNQTFSGPTFAPGSGNTYRLGGGGGALTISAANVLKDYSTSSNVILADDVTFSTVQSYTGTTTLNGGTLTLGANNTLPATAAVIVNVGATLDLNSKTQTLASLTMTAGTVKAGPSGLLTLAGDVIATSSGSTTATINDKLSLGSATRTFTVTDSGGTAASDLKVAAVISGTGVGLIKAGNGLLLLSGANTFTGPTTINAGTLQLGKDSALVSTTTVTVNPGSTFDLNGNDLTLAALSITGGTVQTGAGIQTLNGDLTAASSGSTSALLTGKLALGTATRTFTVNPGGGTAPSDLAVSAVISGTGVGLIKAGNGLLLLSGVNTFTGPTTVNAGTLQLGAHAALASATTVTVNLGATFDLNGKNQTLAGLTLTGGTVQTGSGTQTLTGNVTAASSGSTSALIAGQLALGSATRTFTVNPGGGTAPSDLDVTAVISGTGSLTKAGTGVMKLLGANTYSGTTNVNAGTLAVTTLPTHSVILNGGTLCLLAAADHQFTSLASSNLTINSGTLDLTNNDLLLTGGAARASSLATHLVCPTPVAGSETMTSAVLTGDQWKALHGNGTFHGQTVTSADLVLTYACAGDANHDGQITMDDYLALDAGYLLHGAGWTNGDFNHDGSITAKDYALIDHNCAYQAGAVLASEMIALHTATFGASYTSALAALDNVPEPASLTLLALGGLSLLGRRRR